MNDCVFCSRMDQPEVLFETDSLYVMPDKFPLLPGHILIISKDHLRCHAEAPHPVAEELEAAAARVRRFLREAYGSPALVWENGVCGQTVSHAHLHLLPVAAGSFAPELDQHEDVTPVAGWQPIRDHFACHGGYHFMALEDQRRLIVGRSPALAAVRRWLSEAAGVRFNGRDWLRTTTEEDILEVGRRWRRWAA